MSDIETRLSAIENALRAIQARQAVDEAASTAALRKLHSLAARPETPSDLAEVLTRAGID